MKPFISWDGSEDLQRHTRCTQLEQAFGKNHAVLFNSNQAAISSCLELMGSRVTEVFCVMPVTAPLDAVNGVIRSGAIPILLDVAAVDLQMDPNDLVGLLEGISNVVVYLNRPGGIPLNLDLLEAVQDVPTILDSRLPPLEQQFLCTFNIYDFSCLVGEGSVVLHHDEEKVNELKVIRDLTSTYLPELLSSLLRVRLKDLNKLTDTSKYTELLEMSSESGIIGYKSVTPTYTALVLVPDAEKAVKALKDKGYKAELGAVPAYKDPHVRKRWKEEPDYPTAEALYNRVLLLPNHPLIDAGDILEIINDQESSKKESNEEE